MSIEKAFSVENMNPEGVPQIPALLYGAQRILLPEMHWDSTLDLLDIFALAETIRQQTVADAREALVWDKFYRQDGQVEADGEQLTDEERKTLKSLAKKTSDISIRETYRTVVLQVCWAVRSSFLRMLARMGLSTQQRISISTGLGGQAKHSVSLSFSSNTFLLPINFRSLTPIKHSHSGFVAFLRPNSLRSKQPVKN